MIFVALKRLLHHLSYGHLTANNKPSLSNCSPAPDEEKPKPCTKIWPLHHKPQPHGAWKKEKWWRRHTVTDYIQKKKFSTSSITTICSVVVSVMISDFKWRNHTFHSICFFLRLIRLSLESTLNPSEQPKEL